MVQEHGRDVLYPFWSFSPFLLINTIVPIYIYIYLPNYGANCRLKGCVRRYKSANEKGWEVLHHQANLVGINLWRLPRCVGTYNLYIPQRTYSRYNSNTRNKADTLIHFHSLEMMASTCLLPTHREREYVLGPPPPEDPAESQMDLKT